MTAKSLWQRVFSERRAVLLPLVIAFVANIGVLALGVIPLRQAVKGAEQGAIDARIRLANARRADLAAKTSRDGKDRADVEMTKFYSEVLPRDYNSAMALTSYWLAKIAGESRLRFKSGTYTNKPVQDSNLVKFTAKVDLAGDYADIRRFLYEVETAQQFVIIESVHLSQEGAQQPGSGLEVSLNVATYYVDTRPSGTRSGAQ
jgi:hypothetical protein